MPAYIMCPTLRALVESRECRGGGVRINVTFHLQQFLYSHITQKLSPLDLDPIQKQL